MFLAVLLLAARPAPAETVPDGFAAAWGFMIQSVCVDRADHVLTGPSPLDAACASSRTLRVGEPLPYHKRDWPGRDDFLAQPSGYQTRPAIGPGSGSTDCNRNISVTTFDASVPLL